MTIDYYIGFPLDNTSALTDASAAWTATPATVCHVSLAGSSDPWAATFVDLASTVEAAMIAAGSASFTCVYNATAGTYTLTFDTTLTPSGALAGALGLVDGATYGGGTVTSPLRPAYLIRAAEPGRSSVLPWYAEPDGITVEAVADDGKAYGVSRDTDELLTQWSQDMEPSAAVYAQHALATVPYTWDRFFSDARMEFPIALSFDGISVGLGIYQLRADAKFSPMPVVSDWDGLYRVPIHARYLGSATAPLASLDLSTGGTFSRALAAYYALRTPTNGFTAYLALAAIGARRSADTRGDGVGPSLLMEKAATNYLLQSRALGTSWTADTSTLTQNAHTGPDGAVLADRDNATSGQYGPHQATPGPSGRVTLSAYVRGTSAPAAFQHTLLHSGGSVLIAGHGSAGTTYGRHDVTGSATTNSGAVALDGRDQTAHGGQTATAIDVLIDLEQLEAGDYPTSPIPTTTGTVTRPADTLSYASGSYPTALLSSVVVTFAPDASSAEIDTPTETWTLLEVGSAGDLLQLMHGVGGLYVTLSISAQGGQVALVGPLTFSRGQVLTLTAQLGISTLTVAGATSGNGTNTDGSSGQLWPSGQTLYVGGDHAGGTNVTGRFVGAKITAAA